MFALSNNNDGAFSSNIKEIKMTTTIYNGLGYSTKSINRNFRIKVNGMVDGNKINKLVGVKGLIELIGVEMANKMLRRAFNGKDDKTVCKLRCGIKISFYNK
jgi:hypothetical protein